MRSDVILMMGRRMRDDVYMISGPPVEGRHV